MQVQSFQRARAERLEIAPLGKDDFIYGLRLIDPKHGIADRARNDLAVRRLKLEIPFAPLDRIRQRNYMLDRGGGWRYRRTASQAVGVSSASR